MERQQIIIDIGQKILLSELIRNLSNFGYENVGYSTIGKEGQFSVRGGVVDIWLERYKIPVRIDWIGDKVESIYLFNILTQEKVKNLKRIYILPYGFIPKLGNKWLRKKFPVGEGSYERLFLSEVEPGDFVVHIDYGIGRFEGITDRVGAPNLVIEYANKDKLYVPLSQVERVTKYIGIAGRQATLSRLGGSHWERIKQKVEQDIVIYARQLLDLYAKRELVKRRPFGKDSPWQRQLEESFPFEDTPDQLQATADIKADLEKPYPMDRLLVGDVGFGKTEVAIRAAFKVVQEGKQVAVLVPTTLLAEQHYHIFKERLKSFPVVVDLLSRFKTKKGVSKTLNGLKTGQIDIIIGTSRLLSKDVVFKKLALLIIDEEHRFGVKQKEKLKILKTDLDVLSMSATPIPRSLQMAIAKLRDMSVLKQPPSGRLPVETFVGMFDTKTVKEAIKEELGRGGQVYYVYNKVSDIEKKVREIKDYKLGKVVYAHGKMAGQELEEAMERFYSRRADILVCTSIIGSGLDMPNVNTIIIEDAQNFGLADLHQLRGRVGRSERKAFAYLFYPKNYIPIGSAMERLIAIASASELGSGYKLAKEDLEIRGAGNLLGVEQHGNVSLVGLELYLQLLSQAIEIIKAERQLKSDKI